jgi:hypothetical protein
VPQIQLEAQLIVAQKHMKAQDQQEEREKSKQVRPHGTNGTGSCFNDQASQQHAVSVGMRRTKTASAVMQKRKTKKKRDPREVANSTRSKTQGHEKEQEQQKQQTEEPHRKEADSELSLEIPAIRADIFEHLDIPTGMNSMCKDELNQLLCDAGIY